MLGKQMWVLLVGSGGYLLLGLQKRIILGNQCSYTTKIRKFYGKQIHSYCYTTSKDRKKGYS